MMKKYEIEKLRELPIEGVAQSLGMTVQKHKALCPFHADKHPSLSFKVSKNTFKCFVCDAHGSTIDLAMQVLGKDFKETCQWLSEEYPQCHPPYEGSQGDVTPSCHPEEHSDEGSREHQAMNITQN